MGRPKTPQKTSVKRNNKIILKTKKENETRSRKENNNDKLRIKTRSKITLTY